MSLISILIALAVETFYKPVTEFRRYDWFISYGEKLNAKLAGQSWRDGPGGILLVVGLVVFAVWLVDAMLADVGAPLSFLFGLVVLVYCLGPTDLVAEVHKFTEAMERQDFEAASLYAAEIVDDETPDDASALVQKVKDSILVIANVRVLGVLLWFLILGPMGAALFRVTCLLRKNDHLWSNGFAAAANWLYEILLWPSARLSVVGFALAGSFVDTISNWRSAGDFWQRPSEELLIVSGNGAIRHEQDEEPEEGEPDIASVNNVLALVKRTLIVWLAVLALLTLAGWVL